MPPTEDMDSLRTLDPLNAEWVTLVLLAAFVMLALINKNSPRKWRMFSQAMFSKRLGRQALREELDLRDRTFIGLLLVSVCVLAMFIWQLAVLTSTVAEPDFLRIMAAVVIVVIGQAVVIRSIGMLVKADGGLLEHLYTGLLVIILAGVLLIPLVMLIAYRPDWRAPLLWTGGVVLVFSLLYRWIRAIWIGAGEGVPEHYIIIYLCGAEVLPLLLLIHALRPSLPFLSHL